MSSTRVQIQNESQRLSAPGHGCHQPATRMRGQRATDREGHSRIAPIDSRTAAECSLYEALLIAEPAGKREAERRETAGGESEVSSERELGRGGDEGG